MEILVVSNKETVNEIIDGAFDDLSYEMEIDNLTNDNGLDFDFNRKFDLVIIKDTDFIGFNYQVKAYVFSNVLQKNIPTIALLEDKSRVDVFCGLNLLDYFYEPIDFQRVQLRMKVLGKREESITPSNQVPNKFVLKQKNEVILLDYDKIIFFEKDGKKLFVHLDNEVLTVQESIKVLMTRVPDYFIRVHNSYVVNTRYIERIKEVGNRSYEIFFENTDKKAMMSRYRSDALLKDYYRLSKSNSISERSS